MFQFLCFCLIFILFVIFFSATLVFLMYFLQQKNKSRKSHQHFHKFSEWLSQRIDRYYTCVGEQCWIELISTLFLCFFSLILFFDIFCCSWIANGLIWNMFSKIRQVILNFWKGLAIKHILLQFAIATWCK